MSFACYAAQALQFLGLREPPDGLGAMLAAGQPHSAAQGAPAMLPATWERLQKFYQPFNEQLSQLLSEPSYLEWNKAV